MTFSERIVAALRERVQAGETYAQLSKKSGIAAPHINRLVNHQADPLKMSLLTFIALFPHALITLDGATGESGAPAVDLSDYVPRSEYLDLREKYADLRDRYQDLRDECSNLKSAPPHSVRAAEPAAPYRVYHPASSLSELTQDNLKVKA